MEGVSDITRYRGTTAIAVKQQARHHSKARHKKMEKNCLSLYTRKKTSNSKVFQNQFGPSVGGRFSGQRQTQGKQASCDTRRRRRSTRMKAERKGEGEAQTEDCTENLKKCRIQKSMQKQRGIQCQEPQQKLSIMY